jgi:hypothetical protein
MFSRKQVVRKRIDDFRLRRHFRKGAAAVFLFSSPRRSSMRWYESMPWQHDGGTLSINSLISSSGNAFVKLKKLWNPKEWCHDVRSTEPRSATSRDAVLCPVLSSTRRLQNERDSCIVSSPRVQVRVIECRRRGVSLLINRAFLETLLLLWIRSSASSMRLWLFSCFYK